MSPKKKSKVQSFQGPSDSSTPTTLTQQLAFFPLDPEQKRLLGVYITENPNRRSGNESLLPLYDSDEAKVQYLVALLEEPSMRFCLIETFIHSFFSDSPFFSQII